MDGTGSINVWQITACFNVALQYVTAELKLGILNPEGLSGIICPTDLSQSQSGMGRPLFDVQHSVVCCAQFHWRTQSV